MNGSRSVGRTFLHPAFDYLLVGGGLSLLWIVLLSAGAPVDVARLGRIVPALVFALGVAHMAASTVRLYTVREAFPRRRFLTASLPVLLVAFLTAAAWNPETLGRHLHALSLTWLPVHYAAQACGLALLYARRSGTAIGAVERYGLMATCLVPVGYAWLTIPGSALDWLLSPWVFVTRSRLRAAADAVRVLLGLASLLLPVALFLLRARRPAPPPLICLLVLVSHAAWWVVLPYGEAFVWATLFHGLQYLAVTLVFHSHESAPEPRRHERLVGAGVFYASCLLVGYVVWQIWPLAYRAAGFGWVESVVLVGAAVQVHHFIVDAHLWPFGREPVCAASLRVS